MNIHRHRRVVAIDLVIGGELRSQEGIPVFLLGDLVDIAQKAHLAPLLDQRPLDLGHRGRVTGDRPRLEHRHGAVAATTGHGEVLPGMAFRFEFLLEHVGRLGLPARGPPVQHFDLGGLSLGDGDCQCRPGGQRMDLVHGVCSLVIMRCLPGLTTRQSSQAERAMADPASVSSCCDCHHVGSVM